MNSRNLIAIGFLISAAVCAAIGQERDGAMSNKSRASTMHRGMVSRIERALDSKFQAAFVDERLDVAVQMIARETRVPITIDSKALIENGMDPEHTVTMLLSGITLRSGLHLLLDPLDADFVIENGELKITTKEIAEQKYYVRRYAVQNLSDARTDSNSDADFKGLTRAICQGTPGKWTEQDGESGTITVEGDTLVIRQTMRVHRAIAGLLTAIGRERPEAPPERKESTTASRDSANKIERELASEFTSVLTDIPLKDAVDWIAETHHIPIWIDKKALTEDGVSTDQTVTLVMSGLMLHDGLHMVLDQLNLTFVIEDGVLKITTQEAAEGKVFTRVYPVGDLIADDFQSNSRALMRSIMQSTPGKWDDQDGEGGRMTLVASTRSLVIRNTQPLHREIEGLLTAIRKSMQRPPVPSIAADPDDVPELSSDTFPSQRSRRSRERRPVGVN